MIYVALFFILVFGICVLGVILSIKVTYHRNNNLWSIPILLITLIIAFTITASGAYLYFHSDVKELTVYKNGNIEITGKNGFGELRYEKYEFSKYKVKKSDTNVCDMDSSTCTIQLTPKYYEQYEKTINAEKSVNISIKD